MNQARIKLTGTDPEKLAYVCDQLKKIAERAPESKNLQDDFMALMMLYYAKMFVVEPTLVSGGIDSFVDKILDEKMPRGEANESV